jgi:hypothetical protein
MVEKLVGTTKTHAGIATAALVIGLVALLAPLADIVLGIVAVILGIVALRLHSTRMKSAIAGIITGGFAIFIGIMIALTVSLVFKTSPRDVDVTNQINQQKDFKIGETAKIGPMDVIITQVDRNYVPTAAETLEMNKGIPPREGGTMTDITDQSVTLDESDVEYVRVEGTAKLNGDPSLGDNDTDLASFELNNVLPFLFSDKLDPSYFVLDTKTPTDISYVYRIRKDSSKLTLSYDVLIYTRILAIVGTEGAPTKSLTYTITLN